MRRLSAISTPVAIRPLRWCVGFPAAPELRGVAEGITVSISSRSAVAIHALTMLARWSDRTLTSGEVADSLESNPVLVRRILGTLREAGLVTSTEGRGGGWTLTRASVLIMLMTCTPRWKPVRCWAGTLIRRAGSAKSDVTSNPCSKSSSVRPGVP